MFLSKFKQRKKTGSFDENSHKIPGYNLDSPEPFSDPQPQRAQDFRDHRRGLYRQLYTIPGVDVRSRLLSVILEL